MKNLEDRLLSRAKRYVTSGEQIGLRGKRGVIQYVFYGLRRSKLEEAIKLTRERRDANPPTITSSEEKSLKVAEHALDFGDGITRNMNETDTEGFAFVASYLLSGVGKGPRKAKRALLEAKS